MGHRRYWIFIFMFLLATINYVDRIVLSVSSTPIAQDFGIDKVQLGYLFSSFLWLYVVCLVPMGMIVDKLGTRRVNAAGIGLWSIATALTGLATGFGMLIATRVLMGVGESTTYPASGRVIREWIPLKERALFAAIFNGGAYFGPAIGGLVLAWLVSQVGWRMTFLICAAVGFLWLLAWMIWFRKPEEAGWLTDEERAFILRERNGNTKNTLADGHSIGLRGLLSSFSMLGLMVAQGCAVYTQYFFLTWLPNYLQTERGMSLLKSGALMSLPFLGAVVLTVLLGKLSDSLLTEESARTGGRRRLGALLMLMGSVILLTPLVDNVYLILVLITLALGGVASAVALNIAMIGDLLRTPADSGRATGLLILGGNIFGILAPIVTGYVVQSTGSFNMAFVVAGALLAAGALTVFLVVRTPIGPSGSDATL
ncbi:MAG TPA: MFS transporter [Bradyrhizobium sp.]|uniref:MFS transporter n=1 Tax=Bradyrhizobium sp. TaxID=376 RepID=UPI002D7E9A48|nr:MFS transporter [Bradyrhizobium sp.]HET7886887.1 MFS transporter [Bradyrhizobium sp.]